MTLPYATRVLRPFQAFAVVPPSEGLLSRELVFDTSLRGGLRRAADSEGIVVKPWPAVLAALCPHYLCPSKVRR